MERWKIEEEDGAEYTVCPYCGYMLNNKYYFEPYIFKHCPNCGRQVGVAKEYSEHEQVR